MRILHRINQAIDQFEPTIRLLYRIGIVLALYFGLTYLGNSIYIDDSSSAQDASCEGVAPRISS